VKAFVKQGKKEGYIEIELKGPKGKPNLIIRRNLRAEAKTTSFTLNGKSVSGQEIKNRMAELNVQVGNLWYVAAFDRRPDILLMRPSSTFLPQDKVSSFASMSPQELLKETQRAAGDNRLSSWHQDLIKFGDDLRDLKSVRIYQGYLLLTRY
jgi:chromosome segregation ATPase